MDKMLNVIHESVNVATSGNEDIVLYRNGVEKTTTLNDRLTANYEYVVIFYSQEKVQTTNLAQAINAINAYFMLNGDLAASSRGLTTFVQKTTGMRVEFKIESIVKTYVKTGNVRGSGVKYTSDLQNVYNDENVRQERLDYENSKNLEL